MAKVIQILAKYCHFTPELWRLAPLNIIFYLAQIGASKVVQFSYCLCNTYMRFSQIAGLRKSLIQPVKIPNGAQRLDHRLDCCSDAHWFVLRGLVSAVSRNSYRLPSRGGEADICVSSRTSLVRDLLIILHRLSATVSLAKSDHQTLTSFKSSLKSHLFKLSYWLCVCIYMCVWVCGCVCARARSRMRCRGSLFWLFCSLLCNGLCWDRTRHVFSTTVTFCHQDDKTCSDTYTLHHP